ncbi:oligopeptide/dipeptide ABC transporter, ATPase subunit [Desulfurobacterium thermolithotrophum DSM 11699]|uniref:Oligopeptide/dipeptide ABC transporter, ATPase subunit n=1 Tax=Desulfurobacterium thermolithotrophum (strain DSM 11699 / BSA) TaxID=868864 RepID=F0S245_DESTD|nr:oligopeptide/dipeptide ABC transporter ATP-binding protein [Desulfurobacterium thermolithotrophum]ADY72988.1 oligopeptide/dipeptide ABC transporter, ATPase subunit [Desulfurobacterium thermolithotrophum DSM 11699]
MILEIKEVFKSFPVKKSFFGKVEKVINALNGISLSIFPKETVGVIGESGCGKSTLGKVILDLERPDKGKVLYKGKEIQTLSKEGYKIYRKNVQAIFQNPQNSLNPRMKIWEIVTEGLKINYDLSQKELEEKAKELLSTVGLSSSYLNRYPHQLSGGQKQRIAIARAIALNPELIVADEPTSALDVSVQAQVVNLLVDIQERQGVSYFFISHSLPVVEAISDRVIVMYKGYIVEEGTSKEVFSDTKHPYTKVLISSVPVPDPIKKRKVLKLPDIDTEETIKTGCPFYPRCPKRNKDCLTYDMKPIEISLTHKVSCLLYT